MSKCALNDYEDENHKDPKFKKDGFYEKNHK